MKRLNNPNVRPRTTAVLTACALAAGVMAVGCADTAYLVQSATGHLKMVQTARPLEEWLNEDSTPTSLKQRLLLAQSIRRFGVNTLRLPDNASYQRYAQLPRRAVVWNVVAAPAYSLTLKTWCFPVAGCVGYRGHFDERDAHLEADALREQGLEASVYGVPAYSTLGWTNWLGGDPLLSTFIHYPQGELARMIFHELAHQVLYVKDDTAFNESFATAVERLGSQAWLSSQANADAQVEYTALDARRQAFRALTADTRKKLTAIYATDPDTKPDAAEQESLKVATYTEFRQAYARLKENWGGYHRYDAWVAGANNAAFGALAAYDDWVGAFEVLFRQNAGDWTAFYAAAQHLAQQPRAQRTLQLQQLKERMAAPSRSGGPPPGAVD